MLLTIHFHSYFKELTGCPTITEPASPGETLDDLLKRITARFPRLAVMRNSILFAVGVDYQGRDYVLQEGDEISLFPPVQGG